jgi:hypothetical protein
LVGKQLACFPYLGTKKRVVNNARANDSEFIVTLALEAGLSALNLRILVMQTEKYIYFG